MSLFLKIFAWTLSAGFVTIGAWLGSSVPFEKQWPLFEALRTTASIIFAVIGAWIAIVYPERLKLSFSQEEHKTAYKKNGLSKLFSPIINSTAILCAILVIGVVAPILKTIPALLAHQTTLRGISYGCLVTLTLWQLWTVILTLIPADIIKTNSERESERQSLIDGYQRNSSKE